jgi:chorismate mutase
MTDFSAQADLLKNLEQNLSIYKESIREIADEILEAKVSKYPIFLASREEVAIGRMIIDKEELALEWSIYASTLEEFVRRNIVKENKLNDFRKAWKDPELYFCIFAILDGPAGFIYVPYD